MLRLLDRLRQYLSCFIPALSVLGGFLILVVLASIIGEFHFTKIDFVSVQGFPSDMQYKDTFNIAKAGTWWVVAVYLFWLVAIIGSIAAVLIVSQFLHSVPTKEKRMLKSFMFGIIFLIMFILILLVMNNTPLYSAQDVFKDFNRLAIGFTRHINLTNGLGILSIVLTVLCSGMILTPDVKDMTPSRRLKYLNALLLIGAVIMLVWVFYARILYGLVAVSLVQEQSVYMVKLAPTVSLIIGAVTSIYLVLMYMSAFLWLQYKYVSKNTNKTLTASIIEEGKKDSPKRSFLAHWKQSFMLAGPMMPGLFEVLYNFIDMV